MAGIYIHVPFCKKACHYCDFHFSTSTRYKSEMLRAIRAEGILRKDYLAGEPIETIYFGGGTPSLLHAEEINYLLDALAETHHLSANAEITLEANPDDLDAATVLALRQTPVNRLSIGIQSFFEEDLQWMNRAHTAMEAEGALQRVLDAGFVNLTADLIYGYPLLSGEKWESNIEKMLHYGIPHLSAYAMTVEPRTPLASFIRKGNQPPMNESQSADQFLLLMNRLRTSGFEHYEISNFAKPGYRSGHNSNYWNGVPYLGLGPSAHSYNSVTRQWNVANNARYITSIQQGEVPAEIETLSLSNRINEYLMTALRKSEGVDLEKIGTNFGPVFRQEIAGSLQRFTGRNWVTASGSCFTLTDEGRLFADHIASEIMVGELDQDE